MTHSSLSLLKTVLEDGTGAGVVVEQMSAGLRSGLQSHFLGLTKNQGPLFSITPSGLTRHRVSMRFGSFSVPLIEQVCKAGEERRSLARALIKHLVARAFTDVSIIPPQPLDSWTVTGPDFSIEIILRNVSDPSSEDAIIRTACEVMVPLMACMAELIGYDEELPDEYDVEGRATIATVTRRERSPRNKLLCLSIHGSSCFICGLKPEDVYGDIGSIIEVHHLEPLSVLSKPRAYDPATDLVPLCPNCHRAVHTRRPIPLTPDELRGFLASNV